MADLRDSELHDTLKRIEHALAALSVLPEVIDRSRRVETRLTRFLEEVGFDTQVKRPEWKDGIVNVPSPENSIKAILSVIPDGWRPGVTIICKGDILGTIYPFGKS